MFAAALVVAVSSSITPVSAQINRLTPEELTRYSPQNPFDKLAYYVQKTTGTGLVVDGALFYVERIAKTGMPAYYRGTIPER